MSLFRSIVIPLRRTYFFRSYLVAIQGNLKNFHGHSPALPCFDDDALQYSSRLLKTLRHDLRNAPKMLLRVIFRSSQSDARPPPATACHELHRVFYYAPTLYFALPAFIAVSLYRSVAVAQYRCITVSLCLCVPVSQYRCVADFPGLVVLQRHLKNFLGCFPALTRFPFSR